MTEYYNEFGQEPLREPEGAGGVMHGLVDVAEWLGYEVIEVEGEHVVRQRVNARGAWVEREARATAAEVHLYGAVRALTMAPDALNDVGLRVVAKALGLDTREGVSLRETLDGIVGLLEDARKHREAYQKAEGLVNDLREELIDAQARNRTLSENLRLGPKGGDRGELARQVRRVAQQRERADEGRGVEFCKGVTAMANSVLVLLGEPSLHHTAGEKPEMLEACSEWGWRQEMADRVKQLQADRWQSHAEGSRAYYLASGQHSAFGEVVALLVGEEKV